jgi:fatty-acyl-CoA synthase
MTAEAISAHCRGRLAGYKAPRLVKLVPSLPRTGSGKVRKDVLRAGFVAASQAESQA